MHVGTSLRPYPPVRFTAASRVHTWGQRHYRLGCFASHACGPTVPRRRCQLRCTTSPRTMVLVLCWCWGELGLERRNACLPWPYTTLAIRTHCLSTSPLHTVTCTVLPCTPGRSVAFHMGALPCTLHARVAAGGAPTASG
jgi:hypothetical protein